MPFSARRAAYGTILLEMVYLLRKKQTYSKITKNTGIKYKYEKQNRAVEEWEKRALSALPGPFLDSKCYLFVYSSATVPACLDGNRRGPLRWRARVIVQLVSSQRYETPIRRRCGTKFDRMYLLRYPVTV